MRDPGGSSLIILKDLQGLCTMCLKGSLKVLPQSYKILQVPAEILQDPKGSCTDLEGSC